MSMSSSDMVYRDLKQKGLELTPLVKVVVPDPIPAKAGLIKKITSLASRNSMSSTPPNLPQPQIHQILYSAFIAINQNSIFIYKYNLDEVNKTIQVSHEGTLCLCYNIEKCYVCETRYVQDKDFPIIGLIPGGLVYFNYEVKQNTITQKNIIKMNNVLGVGWISDKQCLILDNKLLLHYYIDHGQLKQKSTRANNLSFLETQIIKKAWVLSKIDQQQDSIISIFYAVVPNKQEKNQRLPMKLKVKQFIRTPDGDILESSNPDFVIQTKSLQYTEYFNIVPAGDYFCLQLANQILVVKKKFQKYRLMDNMMEVMREHKVKLSKKGLVASIGAKDLQLNSIHFADPKCTSRILDVIQFSEQLQNYSSQFKQIWPIMVQKQYTLIFVFQKDKQIILSALIKLQPMQKMLVLAKKSPKQKLQILQDMARNLGITRKDFYLKLWLSSKKQNSDIYQYLLPTKDINTIKNQLKSTLKTRVIHISQMLKILQQISKLNLQNLTLAINQKNYREYVKNDFLRKKIKLNQMHKQVDYRIFDKIYSSSLLDIFVDIISQQLYPVKPKSDPLHLSSNIQPIKQLKSLKHVLQQFKVVLLEQYKSFLIQLLEKFQKQQKFKQFPNKIQEILKRFHFLLPNHPFLIQVQKPSKINQPILRDPKANDTQQQIWFKTVTVSQWQAQITKQKIQKILLNHFPTSRVTETVDQFYNSPYGKQFIRWKHGLITADLDDYAKKLKSLNGVQLYLDVCQFANKCSLEQTKKYNQYMKKNKNKNSTNINPNIKKGNPKISQAILKILAQKNGLSQQALHYCKLYANMHYFMLQKQIIPQKKIQKFQISYLTNLKPQNLVALFFLQNKQHKQHIFNQFQQLYEDKNQFKQVLRKFVQSQDCSRIQLQILMKQIKVKGYQFQQKIKIQYIFQQLVYV